MKSYKRYPPPDPKLKRPPRPERWPSGRTLDQGGALCVLELGTLYVTAAGAERVARVLQGSPGLSGQPRHTLMYRAAGALSYEAELFALELGRISEIVVDADLIEYPSQGLQLEEVSEREMNIAYDRAATGRKTRKGNLWDLISESDSDGDDDDEDEVEEAA